MSRRAVIVSGGRIGTEFGLSLLEQVQPEILIGADHGLLFLHENGIMPTHIVGDFDSISEDILDDYRKHTEIPIRQFQPVKDATDTEIALRLALELHAEEIWLLGATGSRIDHVLGNIQILKIAHDLGVCTYIVDEYNKISLIEKEKRLKKEEAFGAYFSIFPLGGAVEHVTIEGAFYPLYDHTLCPGDSLCVSNEIVDETLKITFPEGLVIFVESRDE